VANDGLPSCGFNSDRRQLSLSVADASAVAAVVCRNSFRRYRTRLLQAMMARVLPIRFLMGAGTSAGLTGSR